MSSFTDELEYEFTGTYYKDRPLYVITKPFAYRLGNATTPVASFIVPSGYVTDFASIPWPFSLVFKPDGPWAKAAVLHDYIYTDHPEISKVVADSIFLEAMLVIGINRIIAHLFFLAVRLYQTFKRD